MSNKKAFIALSDFHSYKYPLNKIRDYYLNEYETIYILGDATDRGPHGDGTNGVQILLDIKYLTERYPGRVIYIPGNHDEFIVGSFIGNNKNNYIQTMIANGGKKTYEDLCNLHKNGELEGLIRWLAHLPIQRTCVSNGQKYVFAHALFNQKLYDINSNYSLYDYVKETDHVMRNRVNNVLWFRKGSYGSCKASELPTTESIMIIGHTAACDLPKNINLEDINGDEIKVYCVDGGIAYNGVMLKYVSGENKTFGTKKDTHNAPVFNGKKKTLPEEKIMPDVGMDDTTRVLVDPETAKAFDYRKVNSLRYKIVTDIVKKVSSWQYPSEEKQLKSKEYFKDEPWLSCVEQPLRQYIIANGSTYNLYYTDDEFWNYKGTDKFNYDCNVSMIRYSDYVKIVLFDYIIYCLIIKYGLDTAICNCDGFFFGTDEDVLVSDDKTGKNTVVSADEIKKYDYSWFTSFGNSRTIATYLGASGIQRVLELHGCSSPSEYIVEKLAANGIKLHNNYIKNRVR